MARLVREQLRNVVAVTALMAIAAVTSYVILQEQRLRIPVLEEKPFELKAEFETAQAVVPGQGQTIRVAGVRVGDVEKVELVDGAGVVTFAIDREFLPIYQDATILMRPLTGLKSMFFELDPGTRGSGEYSEGDVVPMANTAPDINFHEILAALDSDTQAYLRLLLVGAGGGLEGRDRPPRQAPRKHRPDQPQPRRAERDGGRAPRRARPVHPQHERPHHEGG